MKTLLILLMFAFAEAKPKTVKPYVRKDGTSVKGYTAGYPKPPKSSYKPNKAQLKPLEISVPPIEGDSK